MLASVSHPVLQTNNALMVRLAKMDFVLMAVLITKIALDNMSVFKEDVLILAPLEKLVVPIANVRPVTKLNLVAVLQDLLGFPQLSRVA